MKDFKPIANSFHKKKHFLYSLIEQGEGTNLDFKFEISDASKIARSLAAFANTKGGRLLVGVKDNGVIAGIRSDEELYMVQAAAEFYSKPKIPFEVKSWDVNGKQVLEIYIPKSKLVPHLAKDDQKNWKAWIRVNDKNVMADEIMNEIWKLSKKKHGVFLTYDKNEKLLLEYLTNNKQIDLNLFCRMALINKETAVLILGKLSVLRIIDHTMTEDGSIFSIGKDFDLKKYKLNN